MVSTFHVELDGGGGDLQITLPYSMIEPIRETLDAGMQSDVDEVDDRWIKSLREDIERATVSLNCTVAERDISLRDIIDLEAGDVITVDIPDKLPVTANGVPVMNAKLGVSRGNMALQILDKMKRN